MLAGTNNYDAGTDAYGNDLGNDPGHPCLACPGYNEAALNAGTNRFSCPFFLAPCEG